MSRIYIDVSALPEIGVNVTGISRLLLSITKYIMLEHSEVRLLGISFRNEDKDFKIWTLSEIKRKSNGVLNGIIFIDEKAVAPVKGDVILLLGEQWLFPKTFESLKKIKRDKEIQIYSMIHDLVPFFKPELYWDEFPDTYISCINEQLNISDGLFLYSKSTKKDLFEQFPELINRENLVSLIRLGDYFDLPSQMNDFDVPSICCNNDFILSVGTIQPRKNHSLLVKVWRMLIDKYGDNCPHLILVGKLGWKFDELLFEIKNDASLKTKVYLLECANDQDLKWLYESCLFNIFPSLYEGWGLPIAECLTSHSFSLVSNTSSMPEVGGDFVDYFSPFDPNELFKLVDYYLLNPDKLSARINKIEKEFIPTSWSSTTAEIIGELKNKGFRSTV